MEGLTTPLPVVLGARPADAPLKLLLECGRPQRSPFRWPLYAKTSRVATRPALDIVSHIEIPRHSDEASSTMVALEDATGSLLQTPS